MTASPAAWELLASRPAYAGYTAVRRDTYRLPDGSVSDWDVLEQGDTVAVVAVTEQGAALLFRQYRVGPRAAVAELPGGLIDEGEDPVTAGARELLEETGYTWGAVFHAGGEWSGANSTRRKEVVIAAECRRVAEPQWEAGETGVVDLVALPELIDHLLSGALSDAGEAMRALMVFVRATHADARLRALRERIVDALAVPETGESVGSESTVDAIDAFWESADLTDPHAARGELETLLRTHGASRARAAFERASLHDSVGEEEAAIPLYRAALDAGLDARRRTEATIQLASSLRNVGGASESLALLRGIPADDPLADAAQAFLALALHSDDKPVAALRTALQTLIPHVPQYRRSLRAYADELAPLRRIRAISVALLVHEGKVLLETYSATDAHGPFLRAPGGGIEFGESAADAVRREIAEELGATLDEVRPLDVAENIFDVGGRAGHEIVHVFAVRSGALEALADGERLAVRDSHTSVGWVDVADLGGGGVPVYPVGIVPLIERLSGRPDAGA